MAKLRLGQLATDVRNSIGGVTYSRNRGGAYARARVTPLNPQTAAQSAVRTNFAANSKLWSGTLDDTDRQAWTFFAQNNPVTDVFGAAIVLSGNAMLIKLDQVLKQIGRPIITTPPADLSVPALAAITDVEYDSSTPSLTVTTAAQAVVASARYYIFATRPLPGGRAPQKSDFRFLQVATAVAAATTIDLSDAYINLFGTALAGQVVGVLIATVNADSGAVTVGTQYAPIAS